MKVVGCLTLLLYCFLYHSPLFAQEENVSVYQAKKYIDLRLNATEKYNKKVSRQQTKLLSQLKRKENKYARKLKVKDSAAYARYQQDPLTYDSISNLKKSGKLLQSGKGKKNAAIDSLRGIKKFIEDKAHVSGEGKDNSMLSGFDTKLQGQQDQLNANQQVSNLISQRTNNLKTIGSNSKAGLKGFKGMDKGVFYYKEKLKAYKQISEEPSKAEEKALEYLQGQQGFEKYLEDASGKNILAGKSATEMEKMGYQTKSLLNKQIQGKLGNGASAVQERMGSQFSEWNDQVKDIKGLNKTVKETRTSLKQAKQIDKPTFKVNPMRGLPLGRRIEKQLNWQTSRATPDGRPAMFQMSAMAGFKHTPKLSYGLGLAPVIGLGQNWNHIRLTFEGLNLRSYATWEWQYGIGAYGGYERMYKRSAFTGEASEEIPHINPHNTNIYNEAVLLGITKKYKINDRLNGSFQVLYDIWWKEKGLRSPVQLRIATTKNN